ncbi:unnamed protein product [Cylindrotheca closterium]|uniref:Enoyl reductase (ER) domain-containing protein n=1 Tax=Cylindrotheca closterium TaxID=2856 RepID=A0AAD2FZ07_9STRA|nr:unnamed protein product [Cylindrotheca closterium]
MQTKHDIKTMRAAQGVDYGDVDKVMTVEDGVPYWSLKDLPKKKRKGFMIVKTHAVALACGDCRVLSGLTRELQGPPSFPYVPCGDCSGVVVEIPSEEDNKDFPFKVGDRVTAFFHEYPRNALAEYALVHMDVCEIIPESVSSVDAAALASASPAVLLADRIQAGERVLVLGAGGGVGSHLVQLMRKRGASFIAGVSRAPKRLLEPPLSYDRAVDYTKEDVFAMDEFKDNQFDVILDLASGGWTSLQKDYSSGIKKSIIKPGSMGGRYLTITPDNAIFELHSIPAALKLFMLIPLWRYTKSRLWGRSRLPKYSFAISMPDKREVMTRTMQLAEEGSLKAVIDPKGPFPFTTEGVRNAFKLQESRHIQGKVIVETAKN